MVAGVELFHGAWRVVNCTNSQVIESGLTEQEALDVAETHNAKLQEWAPKRRKRQHPRPTVAPLPPNPKIEKPKMPPADPLAISSDVYLSRPFCFWCDEKLVKAPPWPEAALADNIRTRDHLISVPLKHALVERGEFPGHRYIVQCCRGCNQKRSKISGFYRQVYHVQKALIRGYAIPPDKVGALVRFRQNHLLDLVSDMQKLIVERVHAKVRPMLLIETELILKLSLDGPYFGLLDKICDVGMPSE